MLQAGQMRIGRGAKVTMANWVKKWPEEGGRGGWTTISPWPSPYTTQIRHITLVVGYEFKITTCQYLVSSLCRPDAHPAVLFHIRLFAHNNQFSCKNYRFSPTIYEMCSKVWRKYPKGKQPILDNIITWDSRHSNLEGEYHLVPK